MRRDTHSTWAAGPATTSLPTAAAHTHTLKPHDVFPLVLHYIHVLCMCVVIVYLGVSIQIHTWTLYTKAATRHALATAYTLLPSTNLSASSRSLVPLSFIPRRPPWPRATSHKRHPNVSGSGCTSAARMYLPQQRHPLALDALPCACPLPSAPRRLACAYMCVCVCVHAIFSLFLFFASAYMSRHGYVTADPSSSCCLVFSHPCTCSTRLGPSPHV